MEKEIELFCLNNGLKEKDVRALILMVEESKLTYEKLNDSDYKPVHPALEKYDEALTELIHAKMESMGIKNVSWPGLHPVFDTPTRCQQHLPGLC